MLVLCYAKNKIFVSFLLFLFCFMSLTPSAKNTDHSCNGFLLMLVDQLRFCYEGSLLFCNCKLAEIMKRTVYPKLKPLSSFTHPQVATNLYQFLSSVEHKIRSFKNVGNQTVPIANDFHSRTKKNAVSQRLWSAVVSNIPQNTLFCSTLNYPFKIYAFQVYQGFFGQTVSRDEASMARERKVRAHLSLLFNYKQIQFKEPRRDNTAGRKLIRQRPQLFDDLSIATGAAMEDLQFSKRTFNTVSLAHAAFNCCLHVHLYRTKVGATLICLLDNTFQTRLFVIQYLKAVEESNYI